MKTIKTILTVIIVAFITLGVSAQEYKHAVKQAKTLSITHLLGEIKIIGYDGSELVIETNHLEKKPDRAEGLKPVYKNGIKDNTDIGLNLSETGDIIEIKGASKGSEDAEYTFKVPKNLAVYIHVKSPFANEDIDIENLAGEIEIQTMNGDISMKEITGPVVIHTMNGDIDATFDTMNQKSPTSITSMNGHIDVTIPADTPADLKMSSMNGQVYTNFDISFKEEKGDLKYIGGGKDVPGKINGGGVKLTLNSMNDNIYLRKK
jgi:hypothetical protein